MLSATAKASALSLLLGAVSAYPSAAELAPRAYPSIQPYVAPGPDDSRAPCPALNTLANHGYLNHDGRNLERQDIINAFQNQFGMLESTIDLALTNAFTVCEYVTGSSCGTTLKNLTLLAEPHAFEHDHSFSRQDYKPSYLSSFSQNADNQNFNKTIFAESIAVLNGRSHATMQDMNEIRLQRESISMKTTLKGWFTQAKPIQEFEAGFIFAIMGDFNLPDYLTYPQARVEWWEYWFTNESFPYHLGWHPPNPPKNSTFVQSVSARILTQHVTSTPYPLPSGAIGPAPPAASLNVELTATTTYPLPTYTPYAAPGVYANDKRDALEPRATAASEAERMIAAEHAAGPPIVFKNPYAEKLTVEDIAAQQQAVLARASKVQAAYAAQT